MLGYVFWHQPREDSGREAYEAALTAFHHSLARTPPVGLRGSAVFRVAALPWAARVAGASADPSAGWYEDWYLVEDYSALGVLGEAAVGRGHRTPHDDAARRFGAGAGGLYALVEGDRGRVEGRTGEGPAGPLGDAACAVWVARPPGTPGRGLAEMLGDGMDPRHASLWRRQLVFGPAPEFCVLAPEAPAGAAPARLPAGWSAEVLTRELLCNA